MGTCKVGIYHRNQSCGLKKKIMPGLDMHAEETRGIRWR